MLLRGAFDSEHDRVGSTRVFIVLALTAIAVCPTRYASLEALAVFLLAIRFPAVASTMHGDAILICKLGGRRWHLMAGPLIYGFEGEWVS
jgi:hypothetical protein